MNTVILVGFLIIAFTLLLKNGMVQLVSETLKNKSVVRDCDHDDDCYAFLPLPSFTFITLLKTTGLLIGATVFIVSMVALHTDKDMDPGFALLVLGGLSLLLLVGTFGFCLAYFRLIRK